MAYLGRYQLGQSVPLYVRCVDSSKVPTLPDHPPLMRTFQSATLVESQSMPIEDRYVVTGQFRLPLFLGRLYATGRYTVVVNYKAGSHYGRVEDCFDIVDGGDVRGAVVSAYFYERPEANYIVQSLENGSIIKGRNPTI